jgi:hypothetical protein
MVTRLYLDGCSYTYGLNLDPKHTLGTLFSNGGYQVTNASRPGKSNLAIAMDVQNQIKNHDIIIVGWSYSMRFYLKYDDYDIDFLHTRPELELPHLRDTKLLADTYNNFHKYFYSLYQESFADQLSDMLVTNARNACCVANKKMLTFSWEKRNVDFDIYYPFTPPEHRLPCGHLNEPGTKNLHQNLQALLNE